MPLAENAIDGETRTTYVDRYLYMVLIDRICNFRWTEISCTDLLKILQAYYYFSVQFRENLEIACSIYPQDVKLRLLHKEECQTDNLSPWPAVAMVGETLDHDEFIRRALLLTPESRSYGLDRLGNQYLAAIRALDQLSRAKSIASYENDGLSRVFGAVLQARDWRGAALRAFRFFLEKHIEFDSEGATGHGALSRHLAADDSVLPLWGAFHDLLLTAAPGLAPDHLCTAWPSCSPKRPGSSV